MEDTSQELQVKLNVNGIVTFKTFNQWVNHASSYLSEYNKRKNKLICIDKDGFICDIGMDFMVSRNADRFPVTAYFVNLSRTNKS